MSLSLGFLQHILWPCRIDPHLPGMPIVYASDAFLKLTGALPNLILHY